jgi:hypothetical protein
MGVGVGPAPSRAGPAASGYVFLGVVMLIRCIVAVVSVVFGVLFSASTGAAATVDG